MRPGLTPMPGYDSEVLWRRGFYNGQQYSLSCDGPVRVPLYRVLQGGLNFAASRRAFLLAAKRCTERN